MDECLCPDCLKTGVRSELKTRTSRTVGGVTTRYVDCDKCGHHCRAIWRLQFVRLEAIELPDLAGTREDHAIDVMQSQNNF